MDRSIDPMSLTVTYVVNNAVVLFALLIKPCWSIHIYSYNSLAEGSDTLEHVHAPYDADARAIRMHLRLHYRGQTLEFPVARNDSRKGGN